MTDKRYILKSMEYGIVEDTETDRCFDLYQTMKLLNTLNDENEGLKEEIEKLEAQCHCTTGVCSICNNEHLIQKEDYYVSKCEKGHEECSKIDLTYCEDFELVRDYE